MSLTLVLDSSEGFIFMEKRLGYCRVCNKKLQQMSARWCSSKCWNKAHPNKIKEATERFKFKNKSIQRVL